LTFEYEKLQKKGDKVAGVRHAPLENALHFLAAGLSPYELIKISALTSKLAERYFH